MIPHHELKPLDAMKSLGLCMTWMTLGHKLKALKDINNSRVWMSELLRVMSSGLWML